MPPSPCPANLEPILWFYCTESPEERWQNTPNAEHLKTKICWDCLFWNEHQQINCPCKTEAHLMWMDVITAKLRCYLISELSRTAHEVTKQDTSLSDFSYDQIVFVCLYLCNVSINSSFNRPNTRLDSRWPLAALIYWQTRNNWNSVGGLTWNCWLRIYG